MISLAYGCGGPAPATPPPAAPPSTDARPSEPAAEPRAEAAAVQGSHVDGRIHREELLPVLEAGLGRFLQGVETRPVVRDGEFIGFRLVTLWPEDPRFRDLPLGAGDVVTRVNGQPIERPGQALQVWNGLRVASALYVEYLRDGEEKDLRFAIVD
ncbi:MAG: hypothetical protein ACOCXM_08915 [Myxococcota bacterium]